MLSSSTRTLKSASVTLLSVGYNFLTTCLSFVCKVTFLTYLFIFVQVFLSGIAQRHQARRGRRRLWGSELTTPQRLRRLSLRCGGSVLRRLATKPAYDRTLGINRRNVKLFVLSECKQFSFATVSVVGRKRRVGSCRCRWWKVPGLGLRFAVTSRFAGLYPGG